MANEKSVFVDYHVISDAERETLAQGERKILLEIYRARFNPQLARAYTAFHQGRLFAAQTQSFDSWVHRHEMARDKQAAGEIRFLLSCAGETETDYYALEFQGMPKVMPTILKSLLAFIAVRVHRDGLPHSHQIYEKNDFTPMGQDVFQLWKNQNQRNDWLWLG